jgi:hypothetical protein
MTMETKYFQLGNIEKNRIINILKILFGFACIAVAVYWVVFKINSAGNYGSIWLTIIFLTGFGFYEIWSGSGKADRYIEFGKDTIKLKRFIFLKPLELTAAATNKIELFTLKVIFHLNTGKRITLRFGTTYYEVNEKITNELIRFAEENKITSEIINEEI